MNKNIKFGKIKNFSLNRINLNKFSNNNHFLSHSNKLLNNFHSKILITDKISEIKNSELEVNQNSKNLEPNENKKRFSEFLLTSYKIKTTPFGTDNNPPKNNDQFLTTNPCFTKTDRKNNNLSINIDTININHIAKSQTNQSIPIKKSLTHQIILPIINPSNNSIKTQGDNEKIIKTYTNSNLNIHLCKNNNENISTIPFNASNSKNIKFYECKFSMAKKFSLFNTLCEKKKLDISNANNNIKIDIPMMEINKSKNTNITIDNSSFCKNNFNCDNVANNFKMNKKSKNKLFKNFGIKDKSFNNINKNININLPIRNDNNNGEDIENDEQNENINQNVSKDNQINHNEDEDNIILESPINKYKKKFHIKPKRKSYNSKQISDLNINLGYHFLSKKGSKNINQDSLLYLDKIFNINDFSISSVFDGHGLNGHYISNIAKMQFIKYFSQNSKLYYIPRLTNTNSSKLFTNYNKVSLQKYVNPNDLYSKLKSNNYHIIREVYQNIENEIINSDYEIDYSGTTSCSVFKIGDHLICSNIGDSRAILISQKEENQKNMKDNLKITLLSNDHKPNNYFEKQRILNNGGEIRQNLNILESNNSMNINSKMNQYILENPNKLPYRVYVKNSTYPGLAMSRSLGDRIAKQIGVISEPEISDFLISNNDLYIIIATDGLWEYLSNENISKIVYEYYLNNDPKGAIDKLINCATQEFMNISDYIDDISIIIIFLN